MGHDIPHPAAGRLFGAGQGVYRCVCIFAFICICFYTLYICIHLYVYIYMSMRSTTPRTHKQNKLKQTKTNKQTKQAIPIGRPVWGTKTVILPAQQPADSPSEQQPQQQEGGESELFLGGLGLARGYHRRPDLTAERCVRRDVYMCKLYICVCGCTHSHMHICIQTNVGSSPTPHIPLPGSTRAAICASGAWRAGTVSSFIWGGRTSR